jgi:antitoxin component of RelBE/YafQ-DinJ toxin-antitoxin module
MKARLNLTIEQDVLEKAKSYASKMGASVSELVEEYLRKVTEPKEIKEIKTDLFEIVKNLPNVDYPENFDFKKEYYEERKKKYGF